MKLFNLDNFTRGWLVGRFSPAILNKDYELGFKYYQAGDYEPSHFHLMSDEMTIVLSGIIEMNGCRYIKGDIVVQEKGESSDFKCIEDAILGVYRPDASVPNDKHFSGAV